MKSFFKTYYHWLVFFFTSLLFIVSNDHRTFFYHSFSGLEWQSLEGYSSLHDLSEGGNNFRILSSALKSDSPLTTRKAQSKLLEVSEQGLTLRYMAGSLEGNHSSSCQLDVNFVDEKGEIFKSVLLPPSEHRVWITKAIRFSKADLSSKNIILDIRQNADHCWSSVRDRVEWVSSTPFGLIKERIHSSRFNQLLVSIFFAISFIFLIAREYFPWFLRRESVIGIADNTLDAMRRGDLRTFFCFLLISIGTQLRLSPYFHWDEWNALQRVMSSGISSIFIAHNEHVLPLFFFVNLLEVVLFGVYYIPLLIISCLLHGCNAFLIFKLMKELDISEVVAAILSCFFLIIALHGESLQWAFMQSLLFSQLFIFSSLLLALRYFKRGDIKLILMAAVFASLSPLFFGNGFIIAAYFPLLLIFYALKKGIRSERKVMLRALLSIGIISISMFMPFCVYVFSKEGQGHSFQEVNSNFSEWAFLRYLFVASQLGTVFRGLGFLPSVELNAASLFQNYFTMYLPRALLPDLNAELLLAIFGGGFSILLLVLSYYIRKREGVLFWCLGQSFIICSLILPGIGRSHLGLEMALSLRYHYSSLFGLLILLVPFFEYLFCKHRIGVFKRAMVISIFLLYATTQFWTASQFIYFQHYGQVHRIYLDSLSDWRTHIGPEVPYEGYSSEYEGLQPDFPLSIAPGVHPDDIHDVFTWLEKN